MTTISINTNPDAPAPCIVSLIETTNLFAEIRDGQAQMFTKTTYGWRKNIKSIRSVHGNNKIHNWEEAEHGSNGCSFDFGDEPGDRIIPIIGMDAHNNAGRQEIRLRCRQDYAAFCSPYEGKWVNLGSANCCFEVVFE